jgi:opacity protein-like surface antigen
MPRRAIDRKGAFSVGLTTGSYASGYDLGGDFSDFGLGVNARFRPVEGLGFEVAYSVHDETFDAETQRTTTMLQPSVQVFAAPWSRVSPYASVGVTFTERSHDDTWSDGFDEYRSKFENSSFGPHAGVGLEIALGQNAAIDFEARAIGYLDNQEGGTIPGAVQTTFGAQWYF